VNKSLIKALGTAFVGLGLLSAAPMAAAWEPSKPVEFVVPAGTGGGADQMARFIQGVVQKNNLMKQPIIIDGRNIYDPQEMKALGFRYTGMGRK
jgi:tripartite-type tricarboxylate transporter receptor subunit TctC